MFQLLPVEIYADRFKKNVVWEIPTVNIKDQPRYKYRGMHLDVARHFFDVETVKKYIDQLAQRKINYFHWHLTEDQGWRIEIKKYPKLTEVGAWRNGTLIGHYNDQPHQFTNEKYGGYYTQDEIKEIVKYASSKFITVIPEIEMPGHAQAAIAAYPELGCTGEKLNVMRKWGISDNVYCPTEETFEFLENVLTEVINLFPGKYIHIGGDECPKTQWKDSDFCQNLMKEEDLKDAYELQSYFINRIEKYLNSKGKQIIGWDEILEGGLAPNATVMSWRGTEGGIAAAKEKHDVIMTPTSHCYFDYYQSDHPEEPLAIGGFLPLEKVYSFDPTPKSLNDDEANYILGVQANVWTEYIPDLKQLEYMAFPRMDALAEVAWTNINQKSFEDFSYRMQKQFDRYKIQNINAANHFYELNASIEVINKIDVFLNTLATDSEIYYTNNGNTPTINDFKLNSTKGINITESGTIKALAFKDGKASGRVWESYFDLHKASGQQIELENMPHEKYSGNGPASLINGVKGSNERYGDAEWLGFNGKDFVAKIKFEKATDIKNINFRFFSGEGQWIYQPKSIRIFSNVDKTNVIVLTDLYQASKEKVIEKSVKVDLNQVKELSIKVENFGIIPEGNQGAGYPAWLFIDEITVN